MSRKWLWIAGNNMLIKGTYATLFKYHCNCANLSKLFWLHWNRYKIWKVVQLELLSRVVSWGWIVYFFWFCIETLKNNMKILLNYFQWTNAVCYIFWYSIFIDKLFLIFSMGKTILHVCAVKFYRIANITLRTFQKRYDMNVRSRLSPNYVRT